MLFVRVRQGGFLACWRQTNDTIIPEGLLRLVTIHLERFKELSSVLQTMQFAYRKGLGTYDAPLCVYCTLHSALESGQEDRMVQIDFSGVLIGSTIREFCISSVLWVLEILCCLY